jgi:WhiB family redox-sensing transcriptional regulator
MSAVAEFSRWWDLAACRTADPELFFPVTESGPGVRQVAQAKAMCAACGVRLQCLDFATTTRQAHGVWGGTTERERLPQRARRHGQALDRAAS